MRSLCATALLALALTLVPTHGASAYDCPYSLDVTTRVTTAQGKSRTARDNARCICTDPSGTVHMVWEDERDGNLEIYYAAMTADSLLPAVRITHSRDASTHPCLACDSENVYVLWQETGEKLSDIIYVRLRDGVEAARRRITRGPLSAACPVSVVGPDGALHIAWHEGPFKQTAVYYGEIVGDSLVIRQPICTEHPEAFRPDIACDSLGRVLLAWFEGLEIKSRFWDGTSWGEDLLVTTNESRPWRLSVANCSEGKWAVAWFDKRQEGSDVLVKFFDGKQWYGQTILSSARIAYYPSMLGLGSGELAAVWETNDSENGEYSIVLRCYNGKEWSTPVEIYRETVAGRYPSLAEHDGQLHAVWFSGKAVSDEIYHRVLRRK